MSPHMLWMGDNDIGWREYISHVIICLLNNLFAWPRTPGLSMAFHPTPHPRPVTNLREIPYLGQSLTIHGVSCERYPMSLCRSTTTTLYPIRSSSRDIFVLRGKCRPPIPGRDGLCRLSRSGGIDSARKRCLFFSSSPHASIWRYYA